MATGGFLPGAARGGEPDAGTFSIVAFDRETGEIGVAVQSRAFNVGQAVPWVEAGVGGIATQASTNESFGPKGLALLRAGMSAGEVLEWLIAHDEGGKERQIGIVDASGRSAAHTGSGCLEWAGHRNGEGYAIQGNILAGAEVVAAMEKAYLETRGEMAVRLLAALRAAQAAGGDRRGQQSAALLVARPSAEFPEYRHRYVDLRVDDHPEPIREIERLFGVAEGTDLTEAHARFAEEYRRAGKTAAAERELGWLADSVRRALATERPDPSALNGLAWTLASAGLHLAEALQAAETAARLEPDSWEILDTLAEVHFRLGNRERAIEVEEKAAAMAPDVRYLRDQIERFRTGEIPGPTE
ncbi:MAG: DUF1028 domain-containing protein [Acidobacteria bacterium]|nr:DUF1028 domain-containing protein [Acidobacteriota bacterium]